MLRQSRSNAKQFDIHHKQHIALPDSPFVFIFGTLTDVELRQNLNQRLSHPLNDKRFSIASINNQEFSRRIHVLNHRSQGICNTIKPTYFASATVNTIWHKQILRGVPSTANTHPSEVETQRKIMGVISLPITDNREKHATRDFTELIVPCNNNFSRTSSNPFIH